MGLLRALLNFANVDSSTTGAAAGVPGAERECNYELDCQVCKQQMNSLNQLEQHCCRHFMKVGVYCNFDFFNNFVNNIV